MEQLKVVYIMQMKCITLFALCRLPCLYKISSLIRIIRLIIPVDEIRIRIRLYVSTDLFLDDFSKWTITVRLSYGMVIPEARANASRLNSGVINVVAPGVADVGWRE